LWVIERSGAKVHLFGETVGVVDDTWLTDPIQDAVDGSAEFWCEVADAQEIAQSPLLARYGLSSEPLSERLSPSARSSLQDACRALDVDPASLEELRPWLAAQLLEHVLRSRDGIDAGVSVHEVLLARAKQAGKTIRTELPDIDATLSFFDTMPWAVESEYLLWTADRVTADPDEIVRQVSAWTRGDPSVVDEQLAQMQARYPNLYKYLILDRNRAWVPRIDAMLDRGNSFVLVGDSHMTTGDGIPNLLTLGGFNPRSAA